MLILKLIKDAFFVKTYEVLDYKKWDSGFYYKLTIVFEDSSVLFAREYVDELQRDYSFHWQSADNNMIIRWDNAPHYKDILTFPHHKHTNEQVVESTVVSLKDVLNQINTILMEQKP
jgi:hypothetical protein